MNEKKKECYKKIVKPLLAWYCENRRFLPWREEPSPYHVWISEIMLQQTRVEAVKEYYARFMKEFPTVQDLAGAEEERLLKMWEGLGYYNRARNLQKAAVMTMEEHGGALPSTYEELLALPGIGVYTAGAIASIAFGRPVAAVDGNVLRIVARLTGDDTDISLEGFKKSVKENLEEVIPADRPGDFNQALMDLGAMVCLPNGAPRCEACPLEGICEARRLNKTGELPVKKSKKERTIEKKTVLVVRLGNKILLHKRKNSGLLAGMYEFPMMEGFQNSKNVLYYLENLGFSSVQIKKLEPSKHIFSHKEWHMKAYTVRVDEWEEEETIAARERDWCLVEPWQTKDAYPIPSAFAAYMGFLSES